MWRLYALFRFTRPVPVRLKRFLAPELLFIFGMTNTSPTLRNCCLNRYGLPVPVPVGPLPGPCPVGPGGRGAETTGPVCGRAAWPGAEEAVAAPGGTVGVR